MTKEITELQNWVEKEPFMSRPTLGAQRELLGMIYKHKDQNSAYQKECMILLQELLYRQDGVQCIMKILILEQDCNNLQGLERLATVILNKPIKIGIVEYFASIVKQMMILLDQEWYSSIAAYVLVSFIQRWKQAGLKLVVNPIIEPLMRYKLGCELYKESDGDDSDDEVTVATPHPIKVKSKISETQLKFLEKWKDCDLDLDGNLIICSEQELDLSITRIQKLLLANEPSLIFVDAFKEALLCLLCIYQYCASSNRKESQEKIFQFIEIIGKLSSQNEFIESIINAWEFSWSMPSGVLKPGSNGGIMLVYANPKNSVQDSLISHEEVIYKYPLEPDTLTQVLGRFEPSLCGPFLISVLETHFKLQRNNVDNEKSAMYGTLVLHLLSIGSQLIGNEVELLGFVKTALLNHETEMIHAGLQILFNVLDEKKAYPKLIIEEFMVIVGTFCDHEDNKIAMLALQTRAVLALIQGKVGEDDESRFEEAIRDISHELLPIRAHGMGIIRQLVLEKSNVISPHLDSLVQMFAELLMESDRYFIFY
jgi:hypothetical protein